MQKKKTQMVPNANAAVSSSESHSDGILDSAELVGCGPGDSFCARALKSNYDTQLKRDPCSIVGAAVDDNAMSDYVLWLPEYKKRKCEGSGYHLCNTSSRFDRKKVAQESFLQGRGQVTGPRGCFSSNLRFLPKSEFEEEDNEKQDNEKPKEKCHDMTLFARSTRTRRSCGSVSEVDMTERMRPLPGEYAGAFVPFTQQRSLVPNITTDILRQRRAQREDSLQEGVTLGNKKYPSWQEIKAKQDALR